jgi:squalene-associated FAD-dependent desaturase
MKKTVIIMGGGLAGLSSAVFLSNEGFGVSLFESSPKLGGRTYSFFDREKQIYLDNGQHILAGWYENTFDYLKLIGTFVKLEQADRMKLVFCDRKRNIFKFQNGYMPGVLGLISGVFGFKGFTFEDKLRFLKVRRLLNNNKYPGEYLKSISAAGLLDELGQTDNLKKFFWQPFIFAAFNTKPGNVSADLFVKLVKKGTELKKNMSIILSDANLNVLFVDRAVDFLNSKSAAVKLNAGIRKINTGNDSVISVETEDGNILNADYYISAVPDYSLKKLFANEEKLHFFSNAEKLKSSAIISVHIFLKNSLNLGIKENMIGLVDSVVQWVFVKNKKHLCLVISGADFIDNNLTEKENEDIFKICADDLEVCLPGFDSENISDYKVIKEKRATFLPEPGSEKFRFKQNSNFNNLFIAGDWTDTGYPSTIEGAIKSAKICSELILKNKN